jgi:tetratricopeptide (TPR) repeat protein
MILPDRHNSGLMSCLLISRRLVALALACLMTGCLAQSGGITPVHTAFNRGVYQHSKKNYDQAISEFHTAIEENTDDFRAWFNLGAAYQAKADVLVLSGNLKQVSALTDQADKAYRMVIKLKPGNIRASVNIAAIDFERGRKDQAKQRLDKLIETYPRHALPHAAYGAHLIHDKEYEQAREHLLQATKLDPGNLEAEYLLGLALWRLKDTNGARKAFEQALKKDPDDMATMLALGELEYEQKKYNSAYGYLTGALFIEPDLLRAHHLLAQISLKQGNVELAVLHLWKARRLSKNEKQIEGYKSQLVELYKALIEADS